MIYPDLAGVPFRPRRAALADGWLIYLTVYMITILICVRNTL